MKGFIKITSRVKWFLAVFVLLIANNGPVEAIYTMNDTCLYYPQGYISDPDDCQAWGYCSDGILKFRNKCPDGFLYDTAKGMCNYQMDVQCPTSAAQICANLADNDFIPDPNDCSQYCYCSQQRIIKCNSCPPNQSFNPKARKCEYDYTCPNDSVCRLVKNNAFVAAPGSCGQFIRCLDGTGKSQTCSNNYFFNPLTGYCEPNNPCDPPFSPQVENSPITNPPDPCTCLDYNEHAGGVQYIADDNTCYGYYTCTSTNGTGTWRSCPFATHFNPVTKECVSPHNFTCTHDRCGNINLAFSTVPSKNCSEYFICTNNRRSTETYSCKAPYAYFDEVLQGCVQKQPGYAICAASAARRIHYMVNASEQARRIHYMVAASEQLIACSSRF